MERILLKQTSIKKVIIITFVFIIFLCSCQENPNKGTVNYNYRRNIEELIYQKSLAEEKISVPMNYYNKFKSKDGKVNIKIDAIIYTPNARKYPVIRMNICPFSDDIINKIASVFTDGDDGVYPFNILTRNEIEEKLINIKAIINNSDFYKKQFNDEETYDLFEDACNQWLEYYKGLLIIAPVSI